MTALKQENIHAGHRERMRQRFLAGGLEGFQDHEILEMLLFYIVPRSDTNATAHRLLREFGSITRVLHASIDELLAVPGVGKRSAEYLHFMGAFVPVAWADVPDRVSLREIAERKAYFVRRLSHAVNEQFWLASLDDRMQLIRCVLVAEGTPGSVDYSAQILVRKILDEHCSQVILAHNHPNGLPDPSFQDMQTTHELSQLLHRLDIRLIDHIIVAGTRACSMLDIAAYQQPFLT